MPILSQLFVVSSATISASGTIFMQILTIEIGDNVLFWPRVGLYTSNYALDAWEHSQGVCYSKPIKIGDNVWLGAGVYVNQGVTIGDNSVIGSGSVVTKDTPANVVAAGVLCRVIRPITDQDKSNYQP